jgi:type I restriction enzyme S subunit
MNNWATAKLGEVLTERRETPDSNDLDSGRVKIVEKISFGTGQIQLRSNGSTKTGMILVRPGDLLVSGINAAKGAIAIYDESASEPAAATIHYGAYIPNRENVDIHFLWWMLRSRFFQELLFEYVPGGIKTELKAKRLLPIPVPLPPIAEQKRIVARIEELAAQIHGASTLQQQVVAEIETLVISIHLQLSSKRVKNIGQFLMLDEDKVAISPTEDYPQVGVRSFAGGLFPKASTSGTETTYKTYNRLYDGALVLSQVKGWEGAVAVCSSDLAGWFVSPEYRTFRCIPGEASPDYLATLVRTEWFWGRLKNATRGVGARRERTRPEQFIAIEIPIPDLERQKIGEHLFAEIDRFKPLQTETAAELDALLPAILDRAFKGELL